MPRFSLYLALALLGACADDLPALTASDIDLPAPVPGARMGAGYLTLSNNSDQPIRINKVSSPQFASIAMHESVLEDGVSRMIRLAEVTIAPQQSVVFERGAKHLMFRYPAEPSKQVTLQFYADDTMLLSVDVSLEE